MFRTNHGFDPETIAHYQWNGTGADACSVERYHLFPDLFDAVAPGDYGLDDALRTVRTRCACCELAQRVSPWRWGAWMCSWRDQRLKVARF